MHEKLKTRTKSGMGADRNETRGAPSLLTVGRAVQLGLVVNATTSRTAAQSSEVPEPGLGSLEADVWVPSGELDPRALPESHLLRNPPNETTGVCLSGGGSRAAASACGFLRGLIELGLIEGVDFISACSGGAYTLIPFQYYVSGAVNDRELLGPVIPAEKLDQDTLSLVPASSLLQRLAEPILSKFASELVTPRCLDGSDAHEAWQYALSDCFLQPYGLGDKTAVIAADEAHAARIRARNPSFGAPIFTRRPGRPFDIYTATLAPQTRPPSEPKAARAVVWKTEDFVPFDMTPLYCGSPLAREQAFATYFTFARAHEHVSPPDAECRYTVGGYVETFAVGCTMAPPAGLEGPNAAFAGRSEPATARCPLLSQTARRPMSLPKILDFCSNAYCGITNNTGAREALLQAAGLDIGGAYSRLVYWSPAAAAGLPPADGARARRRVSSARSPVAGSLNGGHGARAREPPGEPAPTSKVFVSDAGGHDLAALLPMLQRGVRRVVSFLSLGVQIQTGFDISRAGGPSGTEWSGSEGDLDGQLPAYFGVRAKSCEHMMHSLEHVQVFAPADFWRLMEAVRAKLLAGDYPIVEMEHKASGRP